MSVVVVGSINQDIVVTVDRFPEPGETLLGTGHFTSPGGKGANQAVAAVRLGQRVAMVARVGDDAFGHDLRFNLERNGVDVGHVRIDLDHGTGMAMITLDRNAENTIVVSPGANGELDMDDVARAESELAAADVTLLQLEVPLAAVDAAAELAGGLVVLNPAPARALDPATLAMVDVLVPNRSELGVLTGRPELRSFAEVEEAATSLDGPEAVVVTLGAEGAMLVRNGDGILVAAPVVEAVDTVGAGDAFCGALADALSRGEDLYDAVVWAVHAGALAVTRPGAQGALPTADRIRAVLGDPEGRVSQ